MKKADIDTQRQTHMYRDAQRDIDTERNTHRHTDTLEVILDIRVF